MHNRLRRLILTITLVLPALSAGANDRTGAWTNSLVDSDFSFALGATDFAGLRASMSLLQIGGETAGAFFRGKPILHETSILFRRSEMPGIATLERLGNYTGPTNLDEEFPELAGSLSGGNAAEPEEKRKNQALDYLPAPEPSPVVALVSGVAVLLLVRRRRRQAE